MDGRIGLTDIDTVSQELISKILLEMRRGSLHRDCKIFWHDVRREDKLTSDSDWDHHRDPKDNNIQQTVASLLIPHTANDTTEAQISAAGGQPWLINPAFNDMDSLFKALNDSDPAGLVPVTIMRMFHRKSFGYKVIADFNIEAIIASQTGTAVQADPPPTIHIDQGHLNCLAQHSDGDPREVGRDSPWSPMPNEGKLEVAHQGSEGYTSQASRTSPYLFFLFCFASTTPTSRIPPEFCQPRIYL